MTEVALFWAALGRRGSGDGEDQGDLTVNATVLSESGDKFRILQKCKSGSRDEPRAWVKF